MLLSVRQYAILFGMLVCIVASGFAYYINENLEDTHRKIEASQASSAALELESAINSTLKNIRLSAKEVSEWEEVKQQLDNPEIFAYWYSVRFKKSVFELQKYTLDLMIYDSNGQALDRLDDNSLPYKINVSEVNKFLFQVVSEEDIVYVIPIYASDNNRQIAGYLSSRLKFTPLLKSLGVFQYVDVSNLILNSKNTELVDSLESTNFIYSLNKVDEILLLENQMRASIVKLVLVIVIPIVLLFIVIAIVVGIPVKKIDLFINHLRANPSFIDEESYQGMFRVKEFKNIYESLKQYHIELVQNEEKTSLTLNSIGDAVIATDVEGAVSRMNPVAEKLTGWSLEEAQGRFLKDIFPVIDAVTGEEIENPVDKVLRSGEIVTLSDHTTLISKDGTRYQIEDSAAPIRDSNNQVLGMVLVFNDVTEQYRLREARVESEERFRQLAENINEVFWLGSPLWDEIYYISPAYEKLWGLSASDLYDNPRKWMEAVYPDDREQLLNDIPKSVNDIGEYVEFKEYRITKPSGEIIWIKAKAYPIHDDQGRVVRVAGIAEDITRQVMMEEALRRAQKMDALGKLTGGIAHDFNNMLGVIMGYSELLKERMNDDPGISKYIDQIVDAGERGSKLTRKLLAFSRQTTSDAELININEVLNDKRHMLEKILTARISLVYELQEGLGAVMLDAGELEDVLVNLSINSMHAIDGNGQLTIQTRNTMISEMDAPMYQVKAGEYILLSVADNGSGMDDATKEKIFEPFFSTKGEQGTGLGLSQVYGFVERSGGVIRVYSEPGHGTRIMIYFPRHESVEKDIAIQNKETGNQYKGTENILVVDDEPAILELTREILESNGYSVVSAQSGKQALQILETTPVDLMISDVIMPGQDGFQLASIVKEKYPDIKIQLASGFSDDRHTIMEDDNLRANLLQKPYKALDLLKKIRELLN